MLLIDETLIHKTIDQRYLITRYLGMGGMGSAFKATQIDLNRDVCLKFLRDNALSDVESIARFKREARVLGKLEHPNIVHCYAFGVFENVYPYLVMEFVEGQTLKTLVAAEPLEWQRSCRLMLQVCSALDYAHARGFVHRDIKPENVMVATVGGEEIAKVVDFGLVGKQLGQNAAVDTLTDPHSLLGTVNYMAPEAFQRNISDRSLDVYATGCVLYELLSGCLPFDSENPIAVMYKHMNERLPQLPLTIKPDYVRAELENLIWEATSNDPQKRPPDCRNIADRLGKILQPDHVINGEGISSGSAPLAKLRRGRARSIVLLCAILVPFLSLVLLSITKYGGVARQVSDAFFGKRSGENDPNTPFEQLQMHGKSIAGLVSAQTSLANTEGAHDDFQVVATEKLKLLESFLHNGAASLVSEDQRVKETAEILVRDLTRLTLLFQKQRSMADFIVDLQSELLVQLGYFDAALAVMKSDKPLAVSYKLLPNNGSRLAELHRYVFSEVAQDIPSRQRLRILRTLRAAAPMYVLFRDKGTMFCHLLDKLMIYHIVDDRRPCLLDIASQLKLDTRDEKVALLMHAADAEIALERTGIARDWLPRICAQQNAASHPDVIRLSRLYSSLGQFSQGIELLNKALQTARMRGRSRGWLSLQRWKAQLYLDEGSFDDASRVLQECWLSPEYQTFFKVDKSVEAMALEFDIRGFASLALQTGDYKRVITLSRMLRTASHEDPLLQELRDVVLDEYPAALWYLNACAEAKRFINDDLARAQKLGKASYSARLVRWALFYRRMAAHEDAVELFSKALKNSAELLHADSPHSTTYRSSRSGYADIALETARSLEACGRLREAVEVNLRLQRGVVVTAPEPHRFEAMIAISREQSLLGNKELALASAYQIIDEVRIKATNARIQLDLIDYEAFARSISAINNIYRVSADMTSGIKYFQGLRSWTQTRPVLDFYVVVALAKNYINQNDFINGRPYSGEAQELGRVLTVDPIQQRVQSGFRVILGGLAADCGELALGQSLIKAQLQDFYEKGFLLEVLDCYCWLCDWDTARGNFAAAGAWLGKAETVPVNRTERLLRNEFRMITLLIAKGELEQARQCAANLEDTLRKVKGRTGSLRWFLLEQNRALFDSREGHSSQALDHLMRAKSFTDKLDRDTYSLVQLLIAAEFEKKGDYTAARGVVEQLIVELSSHDSVTPQAMPLCGMVISNCYRRLGAMCHRQGQNQKAREYLAAVADCMRDAVYFVELAQVDLALNDQSQAGANFQRALNSLEGLPDLPQYNFRKCTVYLAYANWLYEQGQIKGANEFAAKGVSMLNDLYAALPVIKYKDSLYCSLIKLQSWYQPVQADAQVNKMLPALKIVRYE